MKNNHNAGLKKAGEAIKTAVLIIALLAVVGAIIIFKVAETSFFIKNGL